MPELIDETGRQTTLCGDCGEAFAYTARELATRGGSGVPLSSRCPACRIRHRDLVNARRLAGYADDSLPVRPWPAPGPEAGAGRLFAATCAECGRGIRLPFRPGGDRPLFCRACMSLRHGR